MQQQSAFATYDTKMTGEQPNVKPVITSAPDDSNAARIAQFFDEDGSE